MKQHRSLLRLVTLLPLLVSMVFTATTLLSELHPIANLNDDAFHFLLVQGAAGALSRSENPFDFWSPVLELGFPQFLYYQHLPHLVAVILDRLLLGQVSLINVFNIVRYVLLVGFPLTVFWSLQKLRFSHAGSVTAAALAPLISGSFNYGFEYDSYIWRGFGMYTQLWAMHLSFICLALLSDHLDRGKGRLLAIVALSALILSHLVYAYMFAISAGILLVVGLTRANVSIRVFRFTFVWGMSALVTSYFWLPFMLSKAYIAASPYLQRWKYDSFGAGKIMGQFITGNLFDHGRLPVISSLVAVGLLATLLTRTRQSLLAAALFIAWLLLYFGRTTWGSMVNLLPMHEGLIMHRFIGSVDVAAILLVAVGAGWLWQRLSKRPQAWKAPVYALLTVALMLPALAERLAFYRLNDVFIDRAGSAVETDEDAKAIISKLKALPPGRTFAGLRTDWGKDMKFGDLAFSDLLTFNQIEAVSPPYQSLSLNSDLLWDFNYRNREDYVLFNVRYIVAPSPEPMPEFLKVLEKSGRYSLYEAQTGGYFTLGRSDIAFKGTQTDFLPAVRAWHGSTLPAAREFPAVELKGAVTAPQYLEANPLSDAERMLPMLAMQSLPKGEIAAQTSDGKQYTASVQVKETAILVLKVSFHPNWHATVDGAPAQTMMVMPSYIGIRVSPGNHQAVIEYQSAPERTLLIIFGLVVLLLAAIVTYRESRQ